MIRNNIAYKVFLLRWSTAMSNHYRFLHCWVLIEHKLNVVRNISDKVIALDYGRKIADGAYDEVANDRDVIEAYLGRKR